jgi:hypothetical protein
MPGLPWLVVVGQGVGVLLWPRGGGILLRPAGGIAEGAKGSLNVVESPEAFWIVIDDLNRN